MTLDNIIMIATILGAITAIILFAGKLIKFVKKIIHFLDDFIGEEERPGQAARPGFSQRLFNMENCMSSVKDDIEQIKIEMQPNSGSTIRDAINRIEKRLNDVEEKITDHVNLTK